MWVCGCTDDFIIQVPVIVWMALRVSVLWYGVQGAPAHQWPVVVGRTSHILEDLVEKSDLEPVTGSPGQQKFSQVQRGKSTCVRP